MTIKVSKGAACRIWVQKDKQALSLLFKSSCSSELPEIFGKDQRKGILYLQNARQLHGFSVSSQDIPLWCVFPFYRRGDKFRDVNLLAGSHTPRRRVRCSEALGLTFLPVLFVMVVDKIDYYQRTYKQSPNNSSIISRSLGVVTAFHFKLLLEKSCLLFSLILKERKTFLQGPGKQPIIE